MSKADHPLSETQKKVIAFMRRPRANFEPAWYAAREAATKKGAEVGDMMPDGTIFAGISPSTRKPMYAAPADAPRRMHFNKAAKYAKDLDVGGKKGFRLPTKAELNILFQNREKGALKGTFNLTRPYPAGYYWSSKPSGDNFAWGQRFSDGETYERYRGNISSVRCVR